MAASQVLSIFVHGAKLIIACKNRLYIPIGTIQEMPIIGMNEEDEKMNLDDTEDLFETSMDASVGNSFQDITSATDKETIPKSKIRGPQLTIAYKYKHQALAYSLQGDYLFSLHIKKSSVDSSKTSSSKCDTLFVECCNLSNFSCVSACLSTFKLHSSENPAFWIETILAKSINKDFLENNISSASDVNEHLEETIFLFVSYVKHRIKVLVLRNEKDNNELIVKDSYDVFEDFKHPIFLTKYHSKSNFDEGFENSIDILTDINTILSTQKADISNLSLALDPSDIRQVLMHDIIGKDCTMILNSDGNLLRYQKFGKELHKTKMLMNNIVACSCDINHGLLVLSQSGILYKILDINHYFAELNVTKEPKSSDIIQTIFNISDILEAVNLEKVKQQNVIRQLQIFTLLQKEAIANKHLTFDARIEPYFNTFNQLQNRLNLKSSINYPDFNSDLWKIVITIETTSDTERSYEQHVIKFPIEYRCGRIFLNDIHLPEVTPHCLPLSVSVQLILHVESKTWMRQLKTNNKYHRSFTSLDFVSVQSAVFSVIDHTYYPDTLSQSLSSNQSLTQVSRTNLQSDDFESFLTQLNKSRPVHSIFREDKVESLRNENEFQNMSMFSVKLTSQNLDSLSTKNNLFSEIKRAMRTYRDSICETYLIRILLFHYTFNVEVKIRNALQPNEEIELSFNGVDSIYFKIFKYDLLYCLRNDIKDQPQKPSHISIPNGLSNKMKHFKKQLEVLGTDESPEVKAKYRKILFHWRRTLNDVMFSVYN